MIELSDGDHAALDSLLAQILDWYKADEVSKLNAIGAISHIFAAAAIDNGSEVHAWLHKGNLEYWKTHL